MAIVITHPQNRSAAYAVTFLDSDGAAITLGAGDKVRMKIGREGATPLLDIVSGAALAGGSGCTAANPSTLTLKQSDVEAADIKPGIYEIEAAIVDNSDGDLLKHATNGVFQLIASQAGGVA